jgi:lysophospholipase L1-like esterase
MKSMKNARSKKPAVAAVSAKRQRSKHISRARKLARIEMLVLLAALLAALVSTLLVIAVDILKLSIVQVGLPVERGVYRLVVDGRDVHSWDDSDGSGFLNLYNVSHNASEEYTIQNVHTNLVLSARIDPASGGLEFEFLPASDGCEQRWLMTFEQVGSRLISTCDTNTESPIWQFDSTGWMMELPAPSAATVADGIYAFSPSPNPQGVLESVDGPSLQIVEKDNSPSQLFELIYQPTGYYKIYNLELERYVDITDDGSLFLNAQARAYCGQEWAIQADGADYRVVSSCTGLVWGALDGINVGTSSFTDDTSALWQIDPRQTVLFVGDSITSGQTNCNYNSSYCRLVMSNAVDTEMSILNSQAVKYIEINVGNPGATASSYLYGMNDKYFSTIQRYRVSVAQIMLGTNDSARWVSGANYVKNMAAIVDKLLAAGVGKVILNQPIYNAVSPRLLSEYAAGLVGLANGETVVIGDVAGYEWFRQNSWHLDAGGWGFHPDQEGYQVLGELWAAAFAKSVEN